MTTITIAKGDGIGPEIMDATHICPRRLIFKHDFPV